jgi:hypothetical protein
MASDVTISGERLTVILSALSLAKMQLQDIRAARRDKGDIWLGHQLTYTICRIAHVQQELTKELGDFSFDWNEHDRQSQE